MENLSQFILSVYGPTQQFIHSLLEKLIEN